MLLSRRQHTVKLPNDAQCTLSSPSRRHTVQLEAFPALDALQLPRILSPPALPRAPAGPEDSHEAPGLETPPQPWTPPAGPQDHPRTSDSTATALPTAHTAPAKPRTAQARSAPVVVEFGGYISDSSEDAAAPAEALPPAQSPDPALPLRPGCDGDAGMPHTAHAPDAGAERGQLQSLVRPAPPEGAQQSQQSQLQPQAQARVEARARARVQAQAQAQSDAAPQAQPTQLNLGPAQAQQMHAEAGSGEPGTRPRREVKEAVWLSRYERGEPVKAVIPLGAPATASAQAPRTASGTSDTATDAPSDAGVAAAAGAGAEAAAAAKPPPAAKPPRAVIADPAALWKFQDAWLRRRRRERALGLVVGPPRGPDGRPRATPALLEALAEIGAGQPPRAQRFRLFGDLIRLPRVHLPVPTPSSSEGGSDGEGGGSDAGEEAGAEGGGEGEEVVGKVEAAEEEASGPGEEEEAEVSEEEPLAGESARGRREPRRFRLCEEAALAPARRVPARGSGLGESLEAAKAASVIAAAGPSLPGDAALPAEVWMVTSCRSSKVIVPPLLARRLFAPLLAAACTSERHSVEVLVCPHLPGGPEPRDPASALRAAPQGAAEEEEDAWVGPPGVALPRAPAPLRGLSASGAAGPSSAALPAARDLQPAPGAWLRCDGMVWALTGREEWLQALGLEVRERVVLTAAPGGAGADTAGGTASGTAGVRIIVHRVSDREVGAAGDGHEGVWALATDGVLLLTKNSVAIAAPASDVLGSLCPAFAEAAEEGREVSTPVTLELAARGPPPAGDVPPALTCQAVMRGLFRRVTLGGLTPALRRLVGSAPDCRIRLVLLACAPAGRACVLAWPPDGDDGAIAAAQAALAERRSRMDAKRRTHEEEHQEQSTETEDDAENVRPWRFSRKHGPSRRSAGAGARGQKRRNRTGASDLSEEPEAGPEPGPRAKPELVPRPDVQPVGRPRSGVAQLVPDAADPPASTWASAVSCPVGMPLGMLASLGQLVESAMKGRRRDRALEPSHQARRPNASPKARTPEPVLRAEAGDPGPARQPLAAAPQKRSGFRGELAEEAAAPPPHRRHTGVPWSDPQERVPYTPAAGLGSGSAYGSQQGASEAPSSHLRGPRRISSELPDSAQALRLLGLREASSPGPLRPLVPVHSPAETGQARLEAAVASVLVAAGDDDAGVPAERAMPSAAPPRHAAPGQLVSTREELELELMLRQLRQLRQRQQQEQQERAALDAQAQAQAHESAGREQQRRQEHAAVLETARRLLQAEQAEQRRREQQRQRQRWAREAAELGVDDADGGPSAPPHNAELVVAIREAGVLRQLPIQALLPLPLQLQPVDAQRLEEPHTHAGYGLRLRPLQPSEALLHEPLEPAPPPRARAPLQQRPPVLVQQPREWAGEAGVDLGRDQDPWVLPPARRQRPQAQQERYPEDKRGPLDGDEPGPPPALLLLPLGRDRGGSEPRLVSLGVRQDRPRQAEEPLVAARGAVGGTRGGVEVGGRGGGRKRALEADEPRLVVLMPGETGSRGRGGHGYY
ncbi:hypothetical protein HYH03_010821 [Edaphochlamys debaryana]|uniref:Uncharacterized protein n=1 Tax=Edaphochlamys debaryana TaxID=47281 RepID=A0A835XVD6_9CHLO|nr:hypothetical protein HYH03_010821 [Edaphochlamys debaryana]|eukprot:KAG2490908.1 hypothetical protein HYH03_010821 [Edaphochlamys debaryana]